jgi:hypothetical protein
MITNFMKKPVYPKIGQLCQIKMENTRHCPLMGKSYKILDWLGNNDIFLVINVIEDSLYTINLDVLYKDKKGRIRIKPTSIELLKQ